MSKSNIIDFKKISKEKSETPEVLNSKKTKNIRLDFKSLVLIVVMVTAIVYPLAYIANQMATIVSLKENINTLETEFDTTKEKNKTIKSEIDGSKSNEFIEKMAREKLKMVKKDETVYIKID